MILFCLFYCIPCIFNCWYVNKLYSNDEIDYYRATFHMVLSIVPLINLCLTFIFLRDLFKI